MEIGLKFTMKDIVDENNVVRDTGKIIYASMFVIIKKFHFIISNLK